MGFQLFIIIYTTTNVYRKQKDSTAITREFGLISIIIEQSLFLSYASVHQSFATNFIFVF